MLFRETTCSASRVHVREYYGHLRRQGKHNTECYISNSSRRLIIGRAAKFRQGYRNVHPRVVIKEARVEKFGER